MSALSAVTRQRLAKLLPLLASDKGGEVIATAAAVGRTLAAAGADWHDLADHVERDAEPIIVRLDAPAHQHQRRTVGVVNLSEAERHDMVAALRRGRARFFLTFWEDEFAGSIIERLRVPRCSLTVRQLEIATRLVAKVKARAA